MVPEDHEGVRTSGNIGFNWNECQTTFMQGRAAIWWDGIGFSAPLLDKTKSRSVDKVGFAPVPAGPKAHNAATFIDGIGIPATAKNKKAAWLFLQWITSKDMLKSSSAPARGRRRACPATRGRDREGQRIPAGMVRYDRDQLKLARSGLPVIVPVTEFRDTIGSGLTNIVGGADVTTELKKATEAFQPVLDKSNEG